MKSPKTPIITVEHPENMPDVPYTVHESAMAREHHNTGRVWVLCIILIALLVITNVGWIIYESSYVDEYVSQDIDTGEGDAIIAGIGDVYYGEGQADDQAENP